MNDAIKNKIWVERYRPSKFEDLILPKRLESELKSLIFSKNTDIPNLLLSGAPGIGKAQPNDEPILTPFGWKLMKDIQPNDYVISELGKPVQVDSVFPKKSLKMYNVIFDDGTNTRCCIDHLWSVNNNSEVVSLMRLISRKSEGEKFNVPVPNAIEYAVPDVILTCPYILGIFLGSSTFDKNARTMHINIHALQNIDNSIFDIILYDGNMVVIKFDEEFINICRDEFNCAELYKLHIQDRRKLLSGILDTSYDKYNPNIITISEKQHIHYSEISEIIASLGGKSKIVSESELFFELPENPYCYSHPNYNQFKKSTNITREIETIEYVGILDGKCIKLVDDSSELYVTKDYIVTHNTTLAKVIINELNADELFINASLDRNIETIRNEVVRFVTGRSISGERKVVVLDEIDNMSKISQLALKSLIETHHKNAMFIFTSNYINKIEDALVSRTSTIDYNFSNSEITQIKIKYLKRIENILKSLKIEYDKKVIISIINQLCPDMRAILNTLQKYSASGTLSSDILENIQLSDISELVTILKNKDFKGTRNYIKTVDSERKIINGLVKYIDDVQGSDIPKFLSILTACDSSLSQVGNTKLCMLYHLTQILTTIKWK